MSNETSPRNDDIATLRTHLFETLTALKNKEAPMDIDRAKAISEVAQTIINSAKVEVEHMKLTGGKGSGFIPAQLGAPSLPANTTRNGNVTTHRLP